MEWWGNTCLPKGDKPHRYNLTVFAIKIDKLDIPVEATAGAEFQSSRPY
jgi:phosphatidylethanolamine-binding protein (PEBP) family uncharacterized protein